MFADACALAAGFTRPVVISSRLFNGHCSCAIGAYLLLNRDGWILTVAHLTALINEQGQAVLRYRESREKAQNLEQDAASKKQFRRTKLHSLNRPAADSVTAHSVWWGADNAQLRDIQVLPAADLALGRLQPFTPDDNAGYPVFKIPSADYRPGRSLCKLGFALHDFTPEYDDARDVFTFPKGAVPLPFFPMEGIFTRVLLAPMPGAPETETGSFIETSSPGLRGQSGGPIFDTQGRVWALQSHTRHYPLQFKPQTPGKATGQVTHQFLNAGVGVHAEQILQFLEQHGIEHQRSD